MSGCCFEKLFASSGAGLFLFLSHFKEGNNVSNSKTDFVDSRNPRHVKCKSFKQGQRL